MSLLISLAATVWSRISGYVLAAGVLLTILFGVWRKGVTDERAKAKTEDLTNANHIRKAGADARAGVDPSGLHDDGWRRD